MIGVQRAISAADQREQRLLAAPRSVGDVAAKRQQAFVRAVVVEGLVERVGELVEDQASAFPSGRISRSRQTPENSGNPASTLVGTFGSAGLRSIAAIA